MTGTRGKSQGRWLAMAAVALLLGVWAHRSIGAGPATSPSPAKATTDATKADNIAMVLILHGCEMPDGNYWAAKCVATTIEALHPDDEIGFASYDWEHPKDGMQWDYPLGPRGDGKAAMAASRTIKHGDMPSFEEALKLALNGGPGHTGLRQSTAGRKHIIIFTDGDPMPPSEVVIGQCRSAAVTLSVVGVFPHQAQLPAATTKMAEALGGRVYGPVNNSDVQKLPDIFVTEIGTARAR